jgi:hypothetical protein
MSINPDCPQCGPYEASEGIYPGHGQQKLGVGKTFSLFDFSKWLLYNAKAWDPLRPSLQEKL